MVLLPQLDVLNIHDVDLSDIPALFLGTALKADIPQSE